MDDKEAIRVIKHKFQNKGKQVSIPLQKRGYFSAKLVEGGIMVSNLGDQPFLPWIFFQETVNLLIRNGGSAFRGDAMSSKLGEVGLPLNSVEGYFAVAVYQNQIGDSVFRRITPIACVLVWAGICDNQPGKLVLS